MLKFYCRIRDILEFELEDSENLQQRLNGVSQIVKKLLLLDVLNFMQPLEIQLNETDLIEFRNFYKEWVSKTDDVVSSIRNSRCLDCNEPSLLIIEKMLPYIKGSIKGVSFYKKSRQIHIAV